MVIYLFIYVICGLSCYIICANNVSTSNDGIFYDILFLAGFMIWFWNLMRYDMDCLDALWEWLREWYDRNIVHSMMYQHVLGIWQWESIDSLTMFDYWTWCDMDTKGLTWFKHQKMGIHITLKMGYGWNWDGGSC